MKKEKFYKLCKNHQTGEQFLQENEGYKVLYLPENSKALYVYLEYIGRNSWQATEESTGLHICWSDSRSNLLAEVSRRVPAVVNMLKLDSVKNCIKTMQELKKGGL